MVAVNRDAAPTPDHIAFLLHMATRRMRTEAEAPVPTSLRSLRAAPNRLLDLIPEEGGRITDLASALQVSKQGLGQLVGLLAERGYVEVMPDPADLRAKLIVRTRRGDRTRRAMHKALAEVEDRWRREVGDERYAVFRDVLGDVVGQAPPSAQN